MSKDIVKDSIKCLANMEIKETTYQVARDIVLDEIERLNNIIKEAIEYINENWRHWCSNHCKYATETINILKGSNKE